ncbi:MAG: flavoprotein, partial [candidate division WOR-3 bacterium]
MGEKQIEVLLGVTGSIAAYKALELVRLIREADWGVTVVMTRSATRLVGVDSFRTLTGRPVALELFLRERPLTTTLQHIDLASGADLIVVAPATANIIGKLASGIGDDLLSTILLAVPREKVRTGRVCFAPAMNTNMWENPVVQGNVEKLKSLGYRFIPPGTGKLACGDTGTGRMASPEEIFAFLRATIQGLPELKGVSVLITTG